MTNVEKNIIISIRQGDEKAFEFLFKMYFRRLCSYAHNFLHNKEESEDIVKDSFVKIWEKRKQLPTDISLAGYLYTTVRNQAINYLKREKKKTDFLQYANVDFEAEYDLLVSEKSDYPVANLILKDIDEKIKQVVAGLPEQCRLVFMKSRFEMLSHEEISQQTGIPVTTIKTQIVRALARLRTELAEYLSE